MNSVDYKKGYRKIDLNGGKWLDLWKFGMYETDEEVVTNHYKPVCVFPRVTNEVELL